MTYFAVDHGPGNHNDGLPLSERIVLRERLLSKDSTIDLLKAIHLGAKELEESYPERLEAYQMMVKAENIFQSVARFFCEGDTRCPTPPDGMLRADEIAEISNIPEDRLREILEQMYSAELLTRKQEAVFGTPCISGGLAWYWPPDSVSYGLSAEALELISTL